MTSKDEGALGQQHVDSLPVLLTLKDIADRLHCSVAWLKGQIADGNLVAAKIAGKHLVSAEDLRAFFDSCKNVPSTKAIETQKRRRAGAKPCQPRLVLGDGETIADVALRNLRRRQEAARVAAKDKRSSAGGDGKDDRQE